MDFSLTHEHGSMAPSPYSKFLAGYLKNCKNLGVVADVGAGSGIQAIVCAPNATKVVAFEIDDGAILDIKANFSANIPNIPHRIVKSDMFGTDEEKFDTIVCNPSSLPMRERNKDNTHYFSGQDGRDMIKKLLLESIPRMKQNSKIIMTHTSLANYAKTLEFARELLLKCEILCTLRLELRPFYDKEWIKNTCKGLWFEEDGKMFEDIYLVEITKNL